MGAVVALVWLPRLAMSMWLDETGTVWFIRSGLFDAVSRSFRFQAGSTSYYVVEWVTGRISGVSEISLRAPSLMGMAVVVWLLYRLGIRLFDRGTAALAAVIFVSLPLVVTVATEARPYPLALAALIGSALALDRWLDTGKPRDAAVYVLALCATVYFHYFVALPLLAHAWYLTYRLGVDSPVTRKQVMSVYAFAAVLLIPLVPNVLRLVAEQGILSNPFRQTFVQILLEIVPGAILAVIAVGFIISSALWRHHSIGGISARNGAVMFLGAWFLVPLLLLTGVSTFTSTYVSVPRYFTSTLPVVALLGAVLLRGLGAVWPQVVVVGAVAGASIFEVVSPSRPEEDWRSAASLERKMVTDPQTPVLFHSGFIEGRQIEWLHDPEKSSYLEAPAAMYPFDGELVPMPFDLEGEASAYLEGVVSRQLSTTSDFLLVTRGNNPFHAWLDQRLIPEGFISNLEANLNGSILIYRYTKIDSG